MGGDEATEGFVRFAVVLTGCALKLLRELLHLFLGHLCDLVLYVREALTGLDFGRREGCFAGLILTQVDMLLAVDDATDGADGVLAVFGDDDPSFLMT